MNPNRDSFFEELDKLEFDKLVKKYCADSMQVRAKRRIKAVVYIVLKNTGLLGTAKRILKRDGA